MTIEIKITGENAIDVLAQLKQFSAVGTLPMGASVTAPVSIISAATEVRTEEEVKEVRKEKKAKAEKVAEPKAEVLAPEKPKYTLQDAIDRAREIAGDGKDEKIMIALKGINTRLGISKVREIPPEKLDGYMKELNAEFPKDAAKPADANMFD